MHRHRAGHQGVAGVEQHHLVPLELEGWLKGGEWVHDLVLGVQHEAVLQALGTATWGRQRAWRLRPQHTDRNTDTQTQTDRDTHTEKQETHTHTKTETNTNTHIPGLVVAESSLQTLQD